MAIGPKNKAAMDARRGYSYRNIQKQQKREYTEQQGSHEPIPPVPSGRLSALLPYTHTRRTLAQQRLILIGREPTVSDD